MRTDRLAIAGRVSKRPCSECPFRRASVPGWLGGGDNGLAADYLRDAHGDGDMACHLSVDDALRSGGKDVKSCAGLAIYRRNVCKVPRGGTAAAARASVEADGETVFSKPTEFLAHHGTPTGRDRPGARRPEADVLTTGPR